MENENRQIFLTGAKKYFIYVRIAVHIVIHFILKVIKGEMRLKNYFIFLYRASLFLNLIKENKIVKRGKLYKLHLYTPAYPTRAFFHSLRKFYYPEPGPISVVFSMTKACLYHCPHCYQRKDGGKDLDLSLLIKTAKDMQAVGVSLFDIEGGEPLTRFDRLIKLINSLDDRAEIWVNTTGDGLSDERIEKLKKAGLFGVMVSLHSPDPKIYEDFTGIPGSFDKAVKALERFHIHGIYTAINCCAGIEIIKNNDLEKLLDLAENLKCSFIQFIHEKSSGLWLGRKETLSERDLLIKKLTECHRRYNSGGRFKKYPSVSAQVYEERVQGFGCTAGGIDRFYLGASGELQPCEFLNISFGNVSKEDFMTIYKRMRKFFPTPGTGWLCCTWSSSINEMIKKYNLRHTPIPWEITQTFISDWQKGKKTEFYKKLRIY